MHGGRAPQVLRSARERLDALLDPALDGVASALESDDLRDVIKAAQLVLDRCGYRPVSMLEVAYLNEEIGMRVVTIIERVCEGLDIPIHQSEVRRIVGVAIAREAEAHRNRKMTPMAPPIKPRRPAHGPQT